MSTGGKVTTPSKPRFSLSQAPTPVKMTSPSQLAKKQKPIRTNLPLPQEIRDQILNYLITLPANHGPIEYIPSKLRPKSSIPKPTRSVVSLQRLKSCKQINTTKSVSRAYRSLRLVSKSVSYDTIRVLLYTNPQYLLISLVRTPNLTSLCRTRSLRPNFKIRYCVEEFRNAYGFSAFLHLKEIFLKISNEDATPVGKQRFRAMIQGFVDAVKENKGLKMLFIQWENFYHFDPNISWLGREEIIRELRAMRRRSKGARTLEVPNELWGNWKREERILAPLLGLKGIPNVKVLGHVSEEWGAFLETGMMSSRGFKVEDFEAWVREQEEMKKKNDLKIK